MKKALFLYFIFSNLFSSYCHAAGQDKNEGHQTKSKTEELIDISGIERYIFVGAASIKMPPEFVKMPEEMLEIKHPDNERPSESWFIEKEHGKISLAFKLANNNITEDQLPVLAEMMKKQLSVFSPKISSLMVNGNKAYRIEMVTPDGANPDGGIFNIMQLTSLEGKLFIATFNTTEDLKDDYINTGISVLSSVTY